MHSMDRKTTGELQPLSSQQAPPLPQRQRPLENTAATTTSEHYQEDTVNPDTASIRSKEAVDNAADVEQHCLLFPTYATRHSRSGKCSKDPLDWNIRVRGWAFSKRSNRRKRLVMSMARKLAGVTKDNKVYETLESRFGMFLASNTQGARFSIQCVGATRTSQMELAGDPNSHDPTVDELMNEMHTSEGALAIAETAKDKLQLRKSLEEHRPQEYMEQFKEETPANRSYHQSSPDAGAGSPYLPADGSPLTRVSSPESQEGSFSDRWTKGAALVKGAYRKYKPIVIAQVSNPLQGTEHEQQARLLRVPSESTDSRLNSRGSSLMESTVSEHSGDEVPPKAIRTDSADTILSQTETHNEDLGHGVFPTVQISSRPGGHFDGTLRVSHEDVQAHRRQSELKRNTTYNGTSNESHPRFLKLHAYHPDMTEPCQGIVNLVDPEGISIISDIDDTIKETDVVAGTRIILRNTFLKDMMDVPGMAKVYKGWWKKGAAIHYVSNSPWQLIPSLLEFFHTHKFPPGSAHLRLHDSVLKTYFMTPGENKRKSIREILMDFPGRKFILVGDSGEIDMEIYTELAVAFPEQVFRIFIRDITSAKLREEAAKMAAAPAPRGRSFASMIPGVTTGFGYFSRQGAGAGGEEGAEVDTALNTITTRATEDSANADLSSGGGGGFASVNDSSLDQPQKPEGAAQPPQKPRRTHTFSSTGSAPQGTPAQTPCVSQSYVVSRDLDAEPMPGAPPVEPPVIKTPYELWLDRVEHCQKQLLEGVMTLFEDASTLDECPVVKAMLRHYEDRHSLDLDEDNNL
ncbi:hypothetical protein BGX23_006015 [Mortierella sp. AD031]|nr:hypothetical protein BGX23_006015 [Mortierella sp. AD031]